jgi:hypothetical protein
MFVWSAARLYRCVVYIAFSRRSNEQFRVLATKAVFLPMKAAPSNEVIRVTFFILLRELGSALIAVGPVLITLVCRFK